MELLHTVKATVLSPLVSTGKDAEEFDADMLHLLLFDCLDNARLSTEQQSALCQQAENFYRSKKLIAGAIRFALRYKDAETVVEQYADYPENAIAYATWVEEEYSKTNLDDNASIRHHSKNNGLYHKQLMPYSDVFQRKMQQGQLLRKCYLIGFVVWP